MLIINVFIPGLGTIIAAFMDGPDWKNVAFGVLQLILTCVLIGWVWAIFWGILIWKKASMPIP